MWMRNTAVVLALASTVAVAGAQDFQIVKVASVAGAAVDQLKPKTIFFNDYRQDETTDKGAFIHFEEWGRTKPVQPQFLSLFPAFKEGMVHKIIDGTQEGGEGRAADVRHRGALQAVAPGRIDRPARASPRCRSSRASIPRSSTR